MKQRRRIRLYKPATRPRGIPSPNGPYIPESTFGRWFIGTETWAVHVLERALTDLERLIANRDQSYPVILDAGCGWGRSFKLLKDRFAPDLIVGVDICPEMIVAATAEASRRNLPVELYCADCTRLPLADGSIDMLFCHQTFHHLITQHEALGDFHRVLRRGGLLLFAESTRDYIHSWMIRLLFRHPMISSEARLGGNRQHHHARRGTGSLEDGAGRSRSAQCNLFQRKSRSARGY
jgi:SAM-dependent methyltransferase